MAIVNETRAHRPSPLHHPYKSLAQVSEVSLPISRPKPYSQYGGYPMPVGYGHPQAYARLTQLDWMMFVVVMVASAVGMLAVYLAPLATWLGQNRQLIVVGFVLSLMAICSQGRMQRLLAAVEIAWGPSTVQNLDAIARMDPTGHRMSPRNQLSVVLLLALPLALSAGYKQLIGGITASNPVAQHMEIGMTVPLKTQLTLGGIPLFGDTMMGYWNDPQYQKAYGYTVYTETPERTVIVDAPLRHSMQTVQDSLRSDQFATVSANVSAIVASMVMKWDTQEDLNNTDIRLLQKNLGFENPGCGNLTIANETYIIADLDHLDTFAAWMRTSGVHAATTFGANNSFWVALGTGKCDETLGADQGSSFFLLSRTPGTENPTLGDFWHQAQGFAISLERYEATWNVSQNDAALLSARAVEPGPLANSTYNFTLAQSGLVEHRWRNYESGYVAQMAEFNFLNPVEAYRQGRDYTNLTTDTTFVAVMVWSRLVHLAGPNSVDYNTAITGSLAYTIPSIVSVQTFTMRQTWEIACIMLVYPIIMLVYFALKVMVFHGNPAVNGVGIVSMLAAVNPAGLNLMKGAGYSGELDREITASFSTVPVFDDERGLLVGHKSLQVDLQPRGKQRNGSNARLQRGVLYN
ncbi:hypothetical protein OHC33_006472 [Knufia fluminis]|uniref:Uncharacterized protein n=1 Tax=Knufia fluminis TaxID=191047 RepID=A0AAN8I542_9EURO|nr:hypothetical protein OHC33_006472 [Knufia fluminis]